MLSGLEANLQCLWGVPQRCKASLWQSYLICFPKTDHNRTKTYRKNTPALETKGTVLPKSANISQRPEVTITNSYDLSRTYHVPSSMQGVHDAKQRDTGPPGSSATYELAFSPLCRMHQSFWSYWDAITTTRMEITTQNPLALRSRQFSFLWFILHCIPWAYSLIKVKNIHEN